MARFPDKWVLVRTCPVTGDVRPGTDVRIRHLSHPDAHMENVCVHNRGNSRHAREHGEGFEWFLIEKAARTGFRACVFRL